MIAAALLQEGHQVAVVPFNQSDDMQTAADEILRHRPKVVGLGIQFQHRSTDFLQLASLLRTRGYGGHITCGGQYPSMAWAEVLENDPAVDSVVLHEGERSIVELCEALRQSRDLADVPGLAIRSVNKHPARTAPRSLCTDLDSLPIAYRYRQPARHLGLAFRPVWGSRGCWGSCAFCAITTYYRDAHAYGGGKKLRLRSVENLAAEMAALWHAEGDTTLFCFHDETLLLPRPADSIERLTALRRQLDALGVGQAGLIGKCRPDCVTPELAKELRRLGVVRMFVGVENGSQRGLDHLGRRTTLDQIERALSAYESANIFVCYNLLLFEPDCELADVRENIDFIRRHPQIPVNFCRAEPYHGTPLHQRIRERATIMGSYLGWDYRIHDDRAEQAFRIAAAAFRERNYDAEGIANRTMGLGYTAQLLRCFYNVSSTRGQDLLERVAGVTRDVTLDTAMFLEQAVDIAASCDLSDHDRIARETALLGLRVSAHNRVAHATLDSVVADICAFADSQPRVRQRVTIPDRAKAAIERVTLAGCFAASLQACGGSTGDDHATGGNTGWLDPAPNSGGTVAVGGQGSTTTNGIGGQVVDMAPPTGGRLSTGGSKATGGMIYDPLPPTGGRSSGGATTIGKSYVGFGGSDALPPTGGRVSTGGTKATGGMVYDALPPSGGRNGGGMASGGYHVDTLPYPTGGGSYGGSRSATGGLGSGGFIVDCVVHAGGVGDLTSAIASVGKAQREQTGLACTVDPAPPECSTGPQRGHAVVDNWRDSAPRRLVRSTDLALYDPPGIRLQAEREARRVRVCLLSDDVNLSVRWESEGEVHGEGQQVYWVPAHEDDALCVAARGPGGIAVATLRACELGDRTG
jgi:radical SAM superfamily enzyme YgiQ (UPF0313 family)